MNDDVAPLVPLISIDIYVPSLESVFNKDERELGTARSQELYQITSAFILRRTADLNSKYLPPKQEYVVFARLQPLQTAMYKAFLGSSVSG